MAQKTQTTPTHNPNRNIEQFNKFLINNADFLQEKFQEYFKNQFQIQELSNNDNINEAIKFIYDVFSFGKYQTDSKMNQTLKKSLKQNIISFIKTFQSKQELFDNKLSVKLLQFCIQNNDMFAVHYDKKQKAEEKDQGKGEQKIIQPTKQNENQQEAEQYQKNIQNAEKQIQKTKQKKQSAFQQKIKENQRKLQQALNQMNHQKSTVFKNNKTQQTPISEQKLKKQASIVFKFYCKQQLNSGGPNATFDKILHQSSSMTLGKFMAFANTTGILTIQRLKSVQNQFQQAKILDKKTLINEFKKILKTKKQMEFQDFYLLLKVLQKLDYSVYSKLGIGKDQVSTKLIKRLKYLNAPFNMKDPFARDKQSKISQGVFIPKITSHSGKFNDSLNEQIQDRKRRFRYLPMQPYPNPNLQKFLKQSQFRQKAQSEIKKTDLNKIQQSKVFVRQNQRIKLQNSKISFNNENLFNERQIGVLQNLIIADQNDDQFLKQYKIPKKNSILGLKTKAPHYNSLHINTEKQVKEDLQQMKVKNRKGVVVKQIKQRVKELQKSERKGQTGIQKKRNQSKPVGSLTNRI